MSFETRKSDTHEERYYHIQTDSTESRLRGVTIFARKVGDRWLATGAFCHRDDVFSRKIGRTKARRRWFNAPQHRIPLHVGQDMTYELALTLAKLAEKVWA